MFRRDVVEAKLAMEHRNVLELVVRGGTFQVETRTVVRAQGCDHFDCKEEPDQRCQTSVLMHA